MREQDRFIEISGTVRAVIFRNEENGYTVLRMETDDGEDLTVVGCIPYAAPGELVLAGGVYTRHPQHGEQFNAEWAQRELPFEKEGIYEYLASGVIKGIGPSTATLLVSHFGVDTLDIIESEPEKLALIKGLSVKKAETISKSFNNQMRIRRLMEFLVRRGLHPRVAMKLYACYGDDALAAVKSDPYILSSERIGVRFSEADRLALGMGFEPDSPQRMSAAVLFELEHNANNGHVFIPREKLVLATAQLINSDTESITESLDLLIDDGEVVRVHVAGVDACYLRRLWRAERDTAERLLMMAEVRHEARVDIDKLIKRIELEQGIAYAPQQKKTLEIAAVSHIMALTGGPGTGKTTTVRAIIALFDILGLKTVLAAPTGRAAKRMTELSGREASTVHRLLEAEFSETGDGVAFRKNEKTPLRCDAVVLDEASMVDIMLMQGLLAAMPPHCRLVMVGDADQLPSVGPGNVFSDVIRSEAVDTVRLTEIFRQTEESRIVRNAHMINKGELPRLPENKGDFFFMQRRSPESTADTIVELCTKRLPEKMGIPSADIQVLSPSRKGESGTQSINLRLQAAINPPARGKSEQRFGEIVFREGDRVMQIRNNYDIIWSRPVTGEQGSGVFNGDIGFIASISHEKETVRVDFDGRMALYSMDMLGELEHAYAMTVHKSQGSEYRAVILSASQGPAVLLTRGVLYTAVTRARELLIIVGDNENIVRMVKNNRQQRRYSGLRARIAERMLD